jgi:hypothetical protein
MEGRTERNGRDKRGIQTLQGGHICKQITQLKGFKGKDNFYSSPGSKATTNQINKNENENLSHSYTQPLVLF